MWYVHVCVGGSCWLRVVGVCWTWPPPGIMTCPTPGLRVTGQTSPFLGWAVNWPQGQSVRLEECVSLCVFLCACVCVWTSAPCDLIHPDKATGPNNKNVYFLSRSFAPSLCMLQAKWREVIKQNKPTGRMTSPKSHFWNINPSFVCYTHNTTSGTVCCHLGRNAAARIDQYPNF